MTMLLQACVILSGAIEAVLGITFVVFGSGHPVVRWLLDLGGSATGSAGATRFVGIFLALACFLAAGLHVLIWRWLRDDRDEAHALINLYGGFAFLGGITLSAAIASGRGAGGAALAAWVPLVVDSLRGAALIAIGNVAHYAPMTVRELRLPERGSGPSRPATARAGGRARSAEERPGRRGDRRGGREREHGGARAPAGPPRPRPATPATGAWSPRQPAPAVASADETGEVERSRRRSRGKRGGRRGRAGRGEGEARPAAAMMEAGRAVSAPRAPAEELTARPLAPAAPVAGERDRERDELHREERFRERQPREDRAREDRPSDGRRRDERRGRSRDRDFRGERLGDEQPRRFDHSPSRSFAAVRPPSARMTEAQGIREGEAAGAPERGEFQGGRRPKRGRYSTGALFRPREKRVHRALGGEATTKWGWPEPEESAKPAGAPGPAGRRPEGRMLDERSNGPQRDEGDDD